MTFGTGKAGVVKEKDSSDEDDELEDDGEEHEEGLGEVDIDFRKPETEDVAAAEEEKPALTFRPLPAFDPETELLLSLDDDEEPSPSRSHVLEDVGDEWLLRSFFFGPESSPAETV